MAVPLTCCPHTSSVSVSVSMPSELGTDDAWLSSLSEGWPSDTEDRHGLWESGRSSGASGGVSWEGM